MYEHLTFKALGVIFVVDVPYKVVISEELVRRMVELWEEMWRTAVTAKLALHRAERATINDITNNDLTNWLSLQG